MEEHNLGQESSTSAAEFEDLFLGTRYSVFVSQPDGHMI